MASGVLGLRRPPSPSQRCQHRHLPRQVICVRPPHVGAKTERAHGKEDSFLFICVLTRGILNECSGGGGVGGRVSAQALGGRDTQLCSMLVRLSATTLRRYTLSARCLLRIFHNNICGNIWKNHKRSITSAYAKKYKWGVWPVGP